ncbi:glycosyl hydrolase family 18 protein [Flavihumibacter stibioxidans]|nr:glycosyl hydrolase family 18 protein [Flavihumibacter stibioxidans]
MPIAPHIAKIARYLIILLMPALMTGCHRKASPASVTGAPGIRILGYLNGSKNWSLAFQSVDLDRITDLNLAFFNPDTNGIIPTDPQLAELIRQAHSKKVRVWMSIGGGSPPRHLAALMKAEQRKSFIEHLTAYAVQNGFDGVDVDLENDLINEEYAPFVFDLSAMLRSKGLQMTAALASWNSHKIQDSTLRLYDFINIMSYDKTGPWNPAKPGPHSPFSMAESDFRYFNSDRNIPASRLLIGVPFYGYGFGGSAPESIAWRNLRLQYPDAIHSDSIILADGGRIYYNGIPTIQRKLQFAKQSGAAGIMIWELRQDSRDQHSLLQSIHEAINKN